MVMFLPDASHTIAVLPVMKASTIRFVDRWLGIPACAVLTLWRRLFDRRRLYRTRSRKIGGMRGRLITRCAGKNRRKA